MDYLSQLRNFVSGAGNTISQNVVKPVQSFGQNLLKNVGSAVSQDFQRSPVVQQYNVIRQATATPQFQQTYQALKSGVTNNPIIKNIANTPLSTAISVLPGAGNLRSPAITPYSPTIGQYANTIVNPLEQGLKNVFQAKNPLQAGQGLLQGAQGAFNATPEGLLFNTTRGGIVGGINSLKTGQPLTKTIPQGILNPSIGQAVAPNIPLLATGIDLLSGSPKGALKSVKTVAQGLKGYSPRAFDIHPADQEIMADFVNAIQTGTNKGNLGQLGKDAQAIAEHYIGRKAVGITNQKLAQAFDALLSSSARAKGEDALQTPFPSMGLVNNRKDMNIPQSVAQEGVNGENTLLKNKPQIPIKLKEQDINNPSLLQGADSSLPLKEPSSLVPPGSQSSEKSITKIPNSENPYFNTNKYNVSNEAKQGINQTIQEVKPQIEQAVGKKLSNQEVINTANNSSKILHTVVDRSQTQDFAARLLRTRQQLAAAADSGKVDKSYIDNLMAIKSHATDIARKLQSFSIGADPKTVTSRDAILDAVLKVETNADKVTEAAKGVDFNDLKQATDFYRQFVKPTNGEWVDLIRYNSMLSSPNTHINNAASNIINTAVVAPVEKTLTGALDFLGSKITGNPQKQFAGEGVQYAKGYLGSLHDAAHQFADSLRGKTITGNLDVRQIPLSTHSRVSNLNLPTRLLEASDQFFTKLTQGGEEAALNYRKGKGVNVGNIPTQALDNAKYRLFRSDLHDKRQGTLLNSVDDFTGLIQKARNSKNPLTSTIAKFTLPFIQTPMNMLKQGIEYSPAGFTTIPDIPLLKIKGAPNKTEQLSKAILGSSAAAATAMLVASGRTTWAEPTDPTKKAAFRAAGVQPYAVKIGSNWVSYSKLPPALGFPIAFISALHDAQQNKTIDQNQLNVILNASAKFGNFFADQSYVKNIGDLVSAAKGSPEAMTRFASNYPQQLVPYRALLGWMARLTDPYQRKVDTNANVLEQQVQQLFTQIPGLSMTVPARTDKSGEPIPNQNPVTNAFSPFKVTTERPDQKQNYDLLQQKSLMNKNIDAAKKMILKGENPDLTGLEQASAAEKKPDLKNQIQLKAQEGIARQKAELSGLTQSINNKIIYNDNGSVKTIDLNPPTAGTGIDAFSNQNWNLNKARTVFGANIPQDQKDAAYKQLGVDKNDVEYDYKSHHSSDVKTQYVESKAQSMSHQDLVNQLLTGRVVSSSGSQFADNPVIDNLYNKGLLSKQEELALKKIKGDKNGKSLLPATGTGARKIKSSTLTMKLPKLSIRKTKLFSPPNLKIKTPKIKQLTYKNIPISLKSSKKSKLSL